LINHPDILQMATQMLNMKDSSLLSAPAAPISTPFNNVSIITD
jgi:hypothetical protein